MLYVNTDVKFSQAKNGGTIKMAFTSVVSTCTRGKHLTASTPVSKGIRTGGCTKKPIFFLCL